MLQLLARVAPNRLRIPLHRWRGVSIGEGCGIGYDTIVETSNPEKVWIGNRVTIGIRVVIIAHFKDMAATDPIRIEDEAFIGPGCIILPGVTIGQGAVVAAGSVVTQSVEPSTLVQGNPARAVARCGVPLATSTYTEFQRALEPL